MGLCHVSELSDEPVLDINACYKAGDMVKAKILKASFIYGQTGLLYCMCAKFHFHFLHTD